MPLLERGLTGLEPPAPAQRCRSWTLKYACMGACASPRAPLLGIARPAPPHPGRPPLSPPATQKRAHSVVREVDRPAVEREAELLPYAPFDDYLELLILFGYVTLVRCGSRRACLHPPAPQAVVTRVPLCGPWHVRACGRVFRGPWPARAPNVPSRERVLLHCCALPLGAAAPSPLLTPACAVVVGSGYASAPPFPRVFRECSGGLGGSALAARFARARVFAPFVCVRAPRSRTPVRCVSSCVCMNGCTWLTSSWSPFPWRLSLGWCTW
jgi:hypothetical protein